MFRLTEIMEWFKTLYGTLAEMMAGAFDAFTGFFIQITGDHNYIHRGKGFALINDSGAVAAGASYAFSFKTPPPESAIFIHLRPASMYANANAMSVTIKEGAVVTGGAAATPINLNRNKKNTSQVVIAKGVTVSGAGPVVIFTDYTGVSGGPNVRAGGSSGGSEHERVLLQDTVYTIEFATIGATTASTAFFDLFWYEETHRRLYNGIDS